MEIEVIQFSLPYGRQKLVIFDAPDALEPKYLSIQRCGCRLTAEALTTGLISLTIEEPNLGDYMIQLVQRVEEIEQTFAEMLDKFDERMFDRWVSVQEWNE